MARPIKAERRTELLRARCSPDEKRRVAEIAGAARLTLSDYMRTIALNQRIKVRQPPAVPVELIREGNSIGVNINQIAYKLNATGRMVPDDLTRTLERLNQWLDEVQGLGSPRHDR